MNLEVLRRHYLHLPALLALRPTDLEATVLDITFVKILVREIISAFGSFACIVAVIWTGKRCRFVSLAAPYTPAFVLCREAIRNFL